MNNFNKVDLIEIIEFYAECNGLIANEGELSQRFDAEIAEAVIARYGTDDSIAMSEEFNNWTDALCRDGEIHEEQYNTYEYVGKYSTD